MTDVKTQTIVFFDGHCGLCNGVVDFMIKHDLKRRLVYSPLQGQTAKTVLTEAERTDLDTVIVVKREIVSGAPIADGALKFRKSDAILECLREIGGIYSAISAISTISTISTISAIIGRVVPRFFRDAIYDFVARNRFKFFGRRESCRAPTAAERALFLP